MNNRINTHRKTLEKSQRLTREFKFKMSRGKSKDKDQAEQSEMSKEFKKLLMKRDNLVTAIMSHEEKARQGNISRSMAVTRLSSINGTFTKYDELMQEIFEHDDYDTDLLEIKNIDVENSFYEAAAAFKEIIEETNNEAISSLSSTMANRTNENAHAIKLPTVSIPTFDGKQLEWTTFFDMFSALVDENQNIAKVNKMHYLRDSLSGPALRIISKIPVSGANYDIAWKALQDRYHNKRLIVNDCLKIFLFQEPIKNQNAEEIGNLVDTTKEAIQCMESMDVSIDDWDPFLVYVLQTKLDKDTASEWEKKLGGSREIPKYRDMLDFLETQHRIVNTPSLFPSKIQKINTARTSANVDKKRDFCEVCKGSHYMLFCDMFNSWNVTQRKDFVKEKRLCVICMKKHDLKTCTSKFRCKKCSGLHSTKLHEDTPTTSQHIHTIASNEQLTSHEKLLATAIVKVKDKYGTNHLMRVLIDQGSEGTIITEKAAQLLCLSYKKEKIPLTGLDGKPLGKVTKSVRIQVQSAIDDSFVMSMEALVMRSVTSPGSNLENHSKNWKHLNKIQLADPEFLLAKKIDLLFGVDIYGIILKDGLRKGKYHEPIAQNTALGWLVFGAACKKKDFTVRINTTRLKNSADEDLDEALKRFWEQEAVNLQPIMSEEHEKCVELCKATTNRLSNGKLQVSLPFKMDPNSENFLGDSRKMAMRRFFHLEKKFEKDHQYFERYQAEMLSYLENGHMNISKTPRNVGYYVPHHAVTREESTTTKQRTVYDASAKSTNKFSLNDRCFSGPTIQPELFDILVRWRTHKIALIADIEKMYRQISLNPEDRKFQKILWRFSKDEPIQTYEINTVMFGVKPAPYLAINATFFLADSEREKFPLASKRVKTDFYVDDGMSGSHSVESAKNLQQELTGLFSAGHMLLRKWASNSEEALDGIPADNRAISKSLTLKTNQTVKTLGMKWTPSTDLLNFTIDLSKLSHENLITKRKLVSDASKLYDPCGLLAPITVKAKIIMQNTFKEKLQWDDVVTPEIQNEWNSYRDELSLIKQMKINRWLQSEPNSIISLHGFCDASDDAYSAQIYLVQTLENNTTSSLVCAKTRVAPIEPVTTARLELCGAVLVANLASRIERNLQIKKENVHLWTDSSIVWHWINSHPSRFQVYVAHRVHEIQTLYPARHWRHVRTHENPADLASRGVSASQLINNSLWFSGPEWLIHGKNQWPKIHLPLPAKANLEERHTRMHITITQTGPIELDLLRTFSNLKPLLRLTARLFRWIRRIRNECTKALSDYVTVDELEEAKLAWVKHIQAVHFAKEIRDLHKTEMVGEKSSLRLLNPKLDKNGILIVDGRLRYAQLSEKQKHPMILPAKSHLTQLILNWAHSTTLHGTIHLTLARVRQEFWILNGRNLVKAFIHNCVPCFRQNPKQMHQLMAPLPMIKTTPSRAFLHCGIDFAGPIEIKSSNKRNAPTEKGYICVFVCMASKAAHLEVVGDLSTQKFILATKRMMARRGICTDLYCDRGTNFQGASNELPRLFSEARANESSEIASLFAADGIRFHFNPPSAPNWGGQWESFVKLTKHHLKRMTTSVKLTFEEMSTLLAQIEACLNSRPLCAMTTDVNDLEPLTPGHFLVGAPLNLIPEPSLLTLKDNALDRFQAIQKGLQIFWKRFYGEYLHAQHPRKKWYKPTEDVNIGDLVVIIDENLPPAKWKMARITEVHPGSDGYVRMVTVKTQHSSFQRPIVKLCKLPINAREDVRDRTEI